MEKCVGRVCPGPARSRAGCGGSPRHWTSLLGQGQASPSWDIILQVGRAWQGQFPGRAGLWGGGDQQQGLIPEWLEWVLGHGRMGEALEEVHLRWSMQIQAQTFCRLQPSCSSPWAALSTLAGFCWQLANRLVFGSKLNIVLKPKIRTNNYMSIHMVRFQFVFLELSVRICLLFIRRTWV